MAMNVYLPVDDEEIIYVKKYMLTSKKKEPKDSQSVKIVGNNEDQSESYKGNKKIIIVGVDLEDVIIKTKQNVILDHLRKNKLINGGKKIELDFTQFYKSDEGQFHY